MKFILYFSFPSKEIILFKNILLKEIEQLSINKPSEEI